MDRVVQVLLLFDRFLLLHVLGKDDAGDAAIAQSDAEGAIDRVPRRGRRCNRRYEIMTDVLEEVLQIDFLLILAAERCRGRLSDDGDHRLVVHRGVVETVQQMDRARPRRRQADARLTGKFCMGPRHECRELFVPRLDEPRLVPGVLERRHDSVDAVSRITEDALHAPSLQSLDHEIADSLRHASG